MATETHVKGLAAADFYVYVHCRLNTGAPFYIGKGRARRAYTHKSRNPHWRNIVAKDGGFHANLIAQNIVEDLAFLVEMEAIDKYRRLGVKLINLTDGGDGVSGYRNPNGAHNKGKPCSEEVKARISATLKAKGCLPPIGWNRGQRAPDETRAKMRAAHIAGWTKRERLPISDETRAKQRAAKLGLKKTPEQCKAMSERMKADPRVKARRFKTTQLGYKHTAEAREKMSAAAINRRSRDGQ